MNLGTLNVGDPQIVRDIAEHNGREVVETGDGWLNVEHDGTVFKAPLEMATA